MFLSFAPHFTVPVKINFRCVPSTLSPPLPHKKPFLFLFFCWGGFKLKRRNCRKEKSFSLAFGALVAHHLYPFCQLFNVYGMQQYQGDDYIIYAIYTSGDDASATCAPNNVQLSRRERPFLPVSRF